jgi:hypothetical protein
MVGRGATLRMSEAAKQIEAEVPAGARELLLQTASDDYA